jgi:MSHA pilin protein MshD
MKQTAGFTLIEMVLAITIISVISMTMLGVMSASAGRSGDAMVATQSILVANAYLQEIQSQAFADPAMPDGEVGRVNFDDVDDYNGLTDVGARDASGTAIAGLAGYRVDVTVISGAWGAPSVPSKLITVRVTDPMNGITVLAGYRTDTP